MSDTIKKWEEMQEESPKRFYVPVNVHNYSDIVDLADVLGCKLQEDINPSYEYVLFNNTNKREGDLNSKSYWFCSRDKDDGLPIICANDLKTLLNLNKEEYSDKIEISHGRDYLADIASSNDLKMRDSAEIVGAKYSNEKAPMGMVLKQFPLALEAVAQRSQFGHEKYFEFDQDWMNFKRVANAEEQYLNGAVRHLSGIGEESELEHLKAAAWNILATLQIRLENG